MSQKIPIALKIRQLVTIFLVGIIVIWFLSPVVLITISAFASPGDYYQIEKVIPTHFTLNQFKSLFFGLEAWKAILTSIKVAGLTMLLSFILGLPAGYALSRYIFPGKNFLKLLCLATKMLPLMVLAVPLLIIFMKMGVSDTIWGTSLAHTAMVLPIIILIFSSILSGVSVDYEEAAMIFGLSRLHAFFRITIPLALPGLAASAIFAFVLSWNEVFVATILTLTNRTLPAHILKTAMASPDYLKFTAGFIMAAPAMVFIFFVRKHLVTMWGISLK
ncbi:sugar ABC transporter permease [Candidatus Atribacteria bacterium RBG_19FT_COMBO_35_14]|uniref:Sugar ABC transporter permease n=1 Tax=Candidatus Sediminicultor quintus TaxID=1797291 RepID=A0A1F5AGN3_9BACT|nr:MAG: sugar ABC transporter permease [Candidatus Atribacteria bacterium RBG_19FT_COMBO_35_14]